MEREGVVKSEGEGWEWLEETDGEGMEEADGEGMEETDREVLDLIAVRCCLLVARQRHRASLLPRCRVPWPCCCRCGPVLCLNEVGWGEGGTGGPYLVSTTTNDECHSSFWLPHRCRRRGTCIPR